MDPLGGLGPTAHALLFGTDFEPPPNLPVNLTFSQPQATLAYRQYQSLPKGILNLATSNWKATRSKTLDSQAKAFTPTVWARQSLGLNLVSALATHLHRALHKVNQASAKSRHHPHACPRHPVSRIYPLYHPRPVPWLPPGHNSPVYLVPPIASSHNA